MNKLEEKRVQLSMSTFAFCEWLEISPATYKKILTGNIINMYVNTFIKIEKKTGLILYEYVNLKKTFKSLQDLNKK